MMTSCAVSVQKYLNLIVVVFLSDFQSKHLFGLYCKLWMFSICSLDINLRFKALVLFFSVTAALKRTRIPQREAACCLKCYPLTLTVLDNFFPFSFLFSFFNFQEVECLTMTIGFTIAFVSDRWSLGPLMLFWHTHCAMRNLTIMGTH